MEGSLDPVDVLERDVAVVVYSTRRYWEENGRWPSLKRLAKTLSVLALSAEQGVDPFGYRTAFKWKADRFGGYIVYNSFIFRKCSFEKFLALANKLLRRQGLRLLVESRGKGRGRIVKVESSED